MKLSIPKKQKGLVLLTGMIFILIVSTAVVASYKNISGYSFGRAYEIENTKRFYHLGAELKIIENKLSHSSFSANQLQILMIKEHIVDARDESLRLLPGALWLKHTEFVQVKGGLEYMIEYLGNSENKQASLALAQPIYAWVFRIHIQDEKARDYTMQSIVHVYPTEVLEVLEAYNEEIRFGRMAWFDYTFGE